MRHAASWVFYSSCICSTTVPANIITLTNSACFYFSQGRPAAFSNADPANGSGAVSQQNRRGILTVSDTVDQPKMKGCGKTRRSRFSIRRHLQKHGLAHADSDSDQETEDSE